MYEHYQNVVFLFETTHILVFSRYFVLKADCYTTLEQGPEAQTAGLN